MLERLTQSLNALAPIASTPLSSIASRSVQSSNALAPIVATVLGKLIVFSAVQPSKALPAIEDTPSGI